MERIGKTAFQPVGFWAPRTAVNVAIRPRLWRTISNAKVSVRFEESAWSQFPSVVRWSYSRTKDKKRLAVCFTNRETYSKRADRWRAISNALGRLIATHPDISFEGIPVDVSDCFDSSVPTSTFRFAKLPGDPHDLIPNPYFLARRHRLSPPIPWERKKDTVYFRGSLTGTTQSRGNPRVAACLAARSVPGADCKLTMFQQTPAALRSELDREGIVCRRNRVKALNSHRYLLEIDGNSSSWHRFWLMGMFRSVPVRFETQWQECWHHRIHEGEHFVAANRHNLGEVIDAVRSAPGMAQAIANAAGEVARGLLSPAGAQQMFEAAWLRRIESPVL